MKGNLPILAALGAAALFGSARDEKFYYNKTAYSGSGIGRTGIADARRAARKNKIKRNRKRKG